MNHSVTLALAHLSSVIPRLWCRAIFALLCAAATPLRAQTQQFSNPVVIHPDGTLTYVPTPKGDRIPDFSTVGYNYNNTPLPDAPGGYEVPVLVTLSPGTGDQTDRIQAAIDWLSSRPLINGFRGALLLKAGRWEIHSVNRLRVTASGVVLRGEGDHPLTGTRLLALGTTNENDSPNTRNSRVIAFDGNANTVNTAARTLVDDVYVPAGAGVIPVAGHPFVAGQRVQVRWPGTAAWQRASLFDHDATADLDPAVVINRIIIATTPGSVTLDAPITTPLDPAYARAYLVPVTAFGHITNVGVSGIYFESAYAHDTDENHAWNAVDFTEVEDGFVHNCTARHFAYALAYVNTSARKITLNRVQVHDSISRVAGGRRYSFVLTGELGLVTNALGRYGRHTFILNWPASTGPNAFVDGVALQSYVESGAHAESWNSGGLWDNIEERNAPVGLQVKVERPAVSSVAWNVVTNQITFENMPLSPNWSLGTTAVAGGPATWVNSTTTGRFAFTAPHLGRGEQWSNGVRMPVRSLYEHQLETRLRAARNPHRHRADPPARVLSPPAFRTPDRLSGLSGAAFSYQLPVSRVVPATSAPNFSATGLPPGLGLNATTGLLSGTLPVVSSETSYALTLSARNIDGTTTQEMTLAVRPAGSPKIPLPMSVEVDTRRTTPLALIPGVAARDVPMVPASRLLAPLIVRANYISDMNGNVQVANVPVPVRGVLPIEGLTSPINVTYNGSTTLPAAPGFYDVVATLDDPVYEASATARLLITAAASVTVTLGNTTAPTAASPVTATSTQPSIPPVITYDGSPAFPSLPGHYAAKAVVADPASFGSRLALVSVGRPSATLAWSGPLTLPFTGSSPNLAVTTTPAGLPTRVSIAGQGVQPGTYAVTAWITDPARAHTPLSGTLTITGPIITPPRDLVVQGSPTGAVVTFAADAVTPAGAPVPVTATPASGSLFPVGTTTVQLSATDLAGAPAQASFRVTVFPGPWTLRQIQPFASVAPGTVDILSATSFRIVGAGGAPTGGSTADLSSGNTDSFTTLSQPWSGDGTFTARVADFASTDSGAKAGIVLRETTARGSPYSSVNLTRGGAANFQHKTALAGAAANTNYFSATASGLGVPEWLRLVRQGDTFTLFTSDDGLAWIQRSTLVNPLSGSALTVGLFVAPRTGGAAATATFDNVSFLTPRESWRQTHFGQTDATGNAADLADPDADGASNLLEYALGTIPDNPASVSLPSVQVSGLGPQPLFLQLTFLRARADLTYQVEASSTLAPESWAAIATNPGQVGQTVTVADTLSVSTNPRRFLRLRVTSP